MSCMGDDFESEAFAGLARKVVLGRISKHSLEMGQILSPIKDLTPLVRNWKFATQCDICGGPLGYHGHSGVRIRGRSIVMYDIGCFKKHGPVYALPNSDPRVMWIRCRGRTHLA